MDLLLATGNQHKIEEMTALLGGGGWRLRTAKDFPGFPDVEESGATYKENALIKARAWAERAGLISLADDSGLEVDALGGRPGVYSNRYAPTSAERITKLLDELSGVEEARRTARFVCVMALAWPDGKTEVRRGVCEGRIAFASAGVGGFGYDPVFFLPEYGQTMAELPADEKNRISHRARAAQAILKALKNASPPLIPPIMK